MRQLADGGLRDRFGNEFGPGLPYARGRLLASSADDYAKLERARRLIAARLGGEHPSPVFNLSGLERSLPRVDGVLYDDELAPALYGEHLRSLALAHFGGDGQRHDIALLNRTSAGLFAGLMVLVQPDSLVVGVSPTYSHPAVSRPVRLLGGKFVDVVGLAGFERLLRTEATVELVVVTRLSVSYHMLPNEEIRDVVALARRVGAKVLMDDAGGARVGPAIFGQPRTLEFDVDAGVTGLDKYGVIGPRLGLLGGTTKLVGEIRARAFEFGLEARPMLYACAIRSLEEYRPERVVELAATTREFGEELAAIFGARVDQTPVIAQLPADDILELALERSGLSESPIVPYEATAAIAMLLLAEHGVLTVHFAGLPPGTSALMFKFLAPEQLHAFGGPKKLASAVDECIGQLAQLLREPDSLRALFFGR